MVDEVTIDTNVRVTKGIKLELDVTLKTFWNEKSIELLYSKEAKFQDIVFDEAKYTETMIKLNAICRRIKAYATSKEDIVNYELIRSGLLGNNMIAKLCGYGAQYNLAELEAGIIKRFKNNISFEPLIDRINRDCCNALCLLSTPFYIDLLNSSRYTFIDVTEFKQRLEQNKNIRKELINFSDHFYKSFEKADIKDIEKFMLTTNFADAFHEKNIFISFSHIYDNIEKYCEPTKFAGDKVQIAVIFNVFKTIDKAMNINYFKNKKLFEFINIDLERDKLVDQTKINKKEGAKEWLI